MKKACSVILITSCLLISAPILASEVNDSLELPEEIKNLTSDQILVPSPPIVPIYPLRVKKDGVNAEVWVKYKILQGKIDSAKIIFCSKNGYDLEKAALMSLKEHDFSKDTTAVNSENKWLYTKVIVGHGIYNSLNGSSRKTIAYQSEANTESEYEGVVERMPELIKKGVPEYPRKAKYAGIEATVYVMVLVGVTGKPVDAKIQKSSDPTNAFGFNDVVLKAAKQCRFKPGIQEGNPVKCWVTFPYEFRLSR